MRILLVFLLIFSSFKRVYGDENNYYVFDKDTNFKEGYSSYDDAYSFYSKNLDNYNNLVLLKDEEVIDMEYGVVEFDTSVDYFDYYSVSRKEKDYIGGSYGVDAAYLKTEDDKVYFVVSGDVGYTNANNVTLHPFNDLDVRISSYCTKDGYLYHNIKTQLEIDFYSLSLCLDLIPSFMQDNSIYYSYDGHYFYSDFQLMIDDYKNDDRSNSINDVPYYNYYQYLPHRSISNYSFEEVNNYFNSLLGFNGRLNRYIDSDGDGATDEINRSQLYNNFGEFFNNQYIYGTNAMMLLSSAIVESSYGKSLNAYLNNNLYTNAAFDSLIEKQTQRYDSISNSIYSHAKYYISSSYGNYLKSSYCGTHFGDKLGGINIEYSLNHYYGESVASEYFKLDRALGYKDYNKCSIAIVKDSDLVLYKDNELKKKLTTLNFVNELSFVVLEELEDSYLIQVDYSFSNEYLYDYSYSVAYVKKNDVDYIFNSDNIHRYVFNIINYDFNGGEYHNYGSLSTKVLEGNDILNIKPQKVGYEFVDYSKKIDENDGSIVYVANYREISSLSIDNICRNSKDVLPYPNLSNSQISIKYADGGKKILKVNTDMIGYIDLNNFELQTFNVRYCGLSKDIRLTINKDYYDNYHNIEYAINDKNYDFIKDNMASIRYPFKESQIREIDSYLKNRHERNYVIKDNVGNNDISISGLDMSLDDRRNFHLIEDTYYVIVDKAKLTNENRIKNIASNYGFNVEKGLKLSFKFNYQNIDLLGPTIVQLKLDDKKTNMIYSVYHINSLGDIVKCRTTQSKKYIQFIANEDGDYVILSLPSMNEYDFDDSVESLSFENMGIDNNRINLEFMIGLSLIIVSLLGIIAYYLIDDLRKKEWKDYKRSFLKADFVQEEKQKNI